MYSLIADRAKPGIRAEEVVRQDGTRRAGRAGIDRGAVLVWAAEFRSVGNFVDGRVYGGVLGKCAHIRHVEHDSGLELLLNAQAGLFRVRHLSRGEEARDRCRKANSGC